MELSPDYLTGFSRVELDLGCGKGSFLTDMATLYPETLFLGMERLSDRVESCRKKIHRLGLKNALIFRGEILDLMKQLPSQSIDTIHILFSDPWPKRRHRERRVFSSRFLDHVYRALKPEGRFRFMTDDFPYFEIAEVLAIADKRFQCVMDEDRVLPKTDFQKIFEQQGKPIHYFVLQPIIATAASHRS